jgi:glyoxylase-like metal-dependent hydrolase (beta-lactamase superfamily II)
MEYMLTFMEIDDTVIVATSDGALVNATIIRTPRGVVVIDSLLRPGDSKDLAEEAWKFGEVKLLINTHWHSDHCYGNRWVKREGTLGIAHEQYWDTLVRERYVLAPGRPYLVDRHSVARPEQVFSSSLKLDDPLPIQILHLPGHSPDSSVVLLPEQGILISGDSVLNSDNERIGHPYFFWGDIDQHIATTEAIADLEWRIVIPGHGLPTGKEKILLDGIYLDRLKGLFEEFFSESSAGTAAEIKRRALVAIPATRCLPGTRSEDFWTPRMHELNLERLIRTKLSIGDNVYELE